MMDNYRTEKTEIPDWMCRQEEYNPSADKEAFLTRSTKSVLSVLARLRFDEGKDGRFSATPSLKLFYTVLYIILTACSGNYLFVLIMCVAVTVRLAFFSASAIRQILSGTAGSVMISIFLLLPAVFMGNPQTLANITARVYVSVTLVGILSAGTSWNKLTASMRTFHVPSLFIFTLDITLKYISVLGEICGAQIGGKKPGQGKIFFRHSWNYLSQIQRNGRRNVCIHVLQGIHRRISVKTEIQSVSVRHCTYFDHGRVRGTVYSPELNEQ